jgi:hypothetical protein
MNTMTVNRLNNRMNLTISVFVFEVLYENIMPSRLEKLRTELFLLI